MHYLFLFSPKYFEPSDVAVKKVDSFSLFVHLNILIRVHSLYISFAVRMLASPVTIF